MDHWSFLNKFTTWYTTFKVQYNSILSMHSLIQLYCSTCVCQGVYKVKYTANRLWFTYHIIHVCTHPHASRRVVYVYIFFFPVVYCKPTRKTPGEKINPYSCQYVQQPCCSSSGYHLNSYSHKLFNYMNRAKFYHLLTPTTNAKCTHKAAVRQIHVTHLCLQRVVFSFLSQLEEVEWAGHLWWKIWCVACSPLLHFHSPPYAPNPAREIFTYQQSNPLHHTCNNKMANHCIHAFHLMLLELMKTQKIITVPLRGLLLPGQFQ